MQALAATSSFTPSAVAGDHPNRMRQIVAAPLEWVRDPLRIVLILLTILTVSRVHQHYAFLAKFRPALVLVVGAVGYAFLNPRYLTRANVLAIWPMRLVAILAVLSCCSAAFGISLGASARFILDSYSKTLAYAFLIALSIRHVRDLYTYVWAYVISCGILAIFSIFVFGITKGNSYVTRLNDMYTYDSNDLGVVMMMGFPLTLLLLTIERGMKRWLVLLILVGISATMARSGSRGGFLGFVAVGIASLTLVKGVSAGQRIIVVVGAVIALAVGAPPGYWKQMGTLLTPEEDYNFTDIDGRKAVFERGLIYVAHYPVFGLGVNNFARAECQISPKIEQRKINGPLRCTPPHNSYLQAASETGVPGFLVWVSIIIGGIVAPLRLRRRLPQAWRRGTQSERFLYGATSFFPVAMIGFAVPSAFVTFAWWDTIYFMAALLSGMYVATRLQLDARGIDEGPRAPQSLAPDKEAGWRVRQSALRSRVWAAERAPR